MHYPSLIMWAIFLSNAGMAIYCALYSKDEKALRKVVLHSAFMIVAIMSICFFELSKFVISLASMR